MPPAPGAGVPPAPGAGVPPAPGASDDEDDVVLAQIRRNMNWHATTQGPRVSDFTKVPGITHQLPVDATPLDFFHLFLPSAWFDKMAFQTNLYATQKATQRGRPDPNWQPTTAEEMKAFVSILIMMGIKNQPRMWLYWSTDPKFNDPWISSIMPKTRFYKLNQYFHIRDTSTTPARGQPGYDPLFKIRELITDVVGNFQKYYQPGREISIDEAMIAFKGRLFFKQYLPMKPNKWGIKVWMLCDAETGYIVRFEIYTGKHGRLHPEKLLGEEVVELLMEGMQGLHHHAYFDRYFTSLRLVEDLLKNGTYATATIHPSRKGTCKNRNS